MEGQDEAKMIDEMKAREKVNEMNKQALQNLLTALAVERYLFDIYGSELAINYNPEAYAMVITYYDPRHFALKNILECVKRAVHQNPVSTRYEIVEGAIRRRDRMIFPSGFSVIAIHDYKERNAA